MNRHELRVAFGFAMIMDKTRKFREDRISHLLCNDPVPFEERQDHASFDALVSFT
jgi:hypothetical protein